MGSKGRKGQKRIARLPNWKQTNRWKWSTASEKNSITLLEEEKKEKQDRC